MEIKADITLFTIVVSPHLMPFADALRRALRGSVTYVYTDTEFTTRHGYGWDAKGDEAWCVHGNRDNEKVKRGKVLISGFRDTALFEQRNAEGLTTFYTSERWFKPSLGFLRVFVPSYFRMVRRFLRALKAPTMLLLPMGIHAARDFARLMGLFSGDIRCLFRPPKVAFESRPGGAVVPLRQAMAAGVLSAEAIAFAKRHGFVQIPEAHWGKVKPMGLYAKMRLWGYFVAPGEGRPMQRAEGPLRILWVGRMLDWKRVSTLVEAVKGLSDVTLDLYGHGPEEENLKRLAEGCEAIQFHDFVPVEQVRELMRFHDVYVLPSDGYEGWGAVVSEALEEGMAVVGTVEAGASATMLLPERLYTDGDVAALRRILETLWPGTDRIGSWTAENAVVAFISILKEFGTNVSSR